MKEFFEAEIKEDCIILTLKEEVRRKSHDELKRELEDYIAGLHRMENQEEDLRLVEIERCHEEYARLVLEHIEAGRELPLHKSYSLNE